MKSRNCPSYAVTLRRLYISDLASTSSLSRTTILHFSIGQCIRYDNVNLQCSISIKRQCILCPSTICRMDSSSYVNRHHLGSMQPISHSRGVSEAVVLT